MENNGFRRAGSLEEPIKNNDTFLRPAGDLDGKPLNSKPTVTMSTADLEKKYMEEY